MEELTELNLKRLTPPTEGRDEISDAKRRGLRLRVYPTRAVWMYEKRIKGGAKRKHTFGTYCTWSASGKRQEGTMGLAAARALALEFEAEAARGFDRVAVAEAQRLADEAAQSSALLVREVLDTYDALHLSGLRKGRERKRQIELALAKKLSTPAGELSKSDLQQAIDAKLAEGKRIAANRLRAGLMAFSRWMWERGHIDDNIGASLPRPTKETSRERFPSLEEVRHIWTATFDMGDTWGPFLRLLILTVQRRSEVLELEWPEVDLENARITKPGSKTKNGKEHITHLSAPAVEELASLQERIESRDESARGLLFTTTGTTPISGISNAKKRLDTLLGDKVEPWRLHDLRTSFSTAMAESGVPEGVADRVLNHSAVSSAPSAVARVYNKALMLPQRAAALDRWAEMVTGSIANVHRLGLP